MNKPDAYASCSSK